MRKVDQLAGKDEVRIARPEGISVGLNEKLPILGDNVLWGLDAKNRLEMTGGDAPQVVTTTDRVPPCGLRNG